MRKQTANEPAAQTIAFLALRIALGYAAAKVHEEGGNNRGDQVEYFQRLMGGAPGDPWCADFVCTCLTKGYARANGLREDRLALPGYLSRVGAAAIALSGSCVGLMRGARARGLWHPRTYRPAVGDLALFDFESVGEPHHVGFVRVTPHWSPGAEALLATVEGNTSAPAEGNNLSAKGDGVFCRIRPMEHVFGYVGWPRG